MYEQSLAGSPGHRGPEAPILRDYEEVAPPEAWEPWAWSAWRFRVHPGEDAVHHLIPPDGTVSLIVGTPAEGVPPRTQVVGPHLSPRNGPLVSGAWWLGIRLWPGAGPGMVQEPVSVLRDRTVALAELNGPLATALDSAIPDPSPASLRRLLGITLEHFRPGEADEAVISAARILFDGGAGVKVSETARQIGFSPRQLRRRFKSAAGVGPKELARAFRARAASVGLVETSANLSRISHETGYADHAHMVRDFQSVLGSTPTEVRENLRAVRHGWVRVPDAR